MSWNVMVRNADLGIEGPLDDFTRLEMVQRFNDVGTIVVDLDRSVPVAAYLDDDRAGLIVRYDDEVVMSGMVRGIDRDWSKDGDRLTVTVESDDVWLARRLGYPDPATGDHNAVEADVRTGTAETVLRAYVDANLGPSALSVRVVDGLALLADEARGSEVTGRARFQPLIELLQELALAGGDLGFTVRQAGPADPITAGLLFVVYEPKDRSGEAKFSPALGNLARFRLSERAPAANSLVVGGPGEGTSRILEDVDDPDGVARWGRIEGFTDRRDATNIYELIQAAEAELREQAAAMTVEVTPVDTEAVAYLRDYRLGDQVQVTIDGVPFTEVVRQVKVRIDADAGVTVQPSVGQPSRQKLLDTFARLRRAETRVSRIERT